MNPKERFLAVYSETERKKLDRVPSFVQYVRPEFISQNEDLLFGSYQEELFYNLRFDAPLVLGFDAVFADIPHSASCSQVELTDKAGKKHITSTSGQVSKEVGQFYNQGLLFSMENLEKLRETLKISDASDSIRKTISFYESVSNKIFPVVAIGGIFDDTWMAMGMTDFSINYRKKTRLYSEVLKFFAEVMIGNVQGLIDATNGRAGVVNLLDDVAFKGRTMISPERWLEDIGPYYKKVNKMIHDAGMVAQLHTDGDVTELIPAFQQVGFQGLQGWEGGMDPVKANEQFPDFVVVGFGDVGDVLPFGTPQIIENHVKTLMDALKENRHFVIGPSTVIVKEMPYSNVLNFMAAIKKYGLYSK